MSVVSFTSILWNLSGDLSAFGLQIPRAMFWSVFVYVAFATVIAFALGRPLIRLSFNNESSTRRSATRWCACATPPSRSRCTAARRSNDRSYANVRRGGRQLQTLRQPDHGVHRVEPVDEPHHHPAALGAASPDTDLDAEVDERGVGGLGVASCTR